MKKNCITNNFNEDFFCFVFDLFVLPSSFAKKKKTKSINNKRTFQSPLYDSSQALLSFSLPFCVSQANALAPLKKKKDKAKNIHHYIFISSHSFPVQFSSIYLLVLLCRGTALISHPQHSFYPIPLSTDYNIIVIFTSLLLLSLHQRLFSSSYLESKRVLKMN